MADRYEAGVCGSCVFWDDSYWNRTHCKLEGKDPIVEETRGYAKTRIYDCCARYQLDPNKLEAK